MVLSKTRVLWYLAGCMMTTSARSREGANEWPMKSFGVDITVLDLDRAVKFYSEVLGQEVKKQDFPVVTHFELEKV